MRRALEAKLAKLACTPKLKKWFDGNGVDWRDQFKLADFLERCADADEM